MPLILIKNLSKHFKQGDKIIRALDDVSINIEKGDFVVIIGASGSGKTTLLTLIGGLDAPTKGAVAIDGKEINFKNERELTRTRQSSIGFVFQNYNLIPTLTAGQNVESALARRQGKKDKKIILQALAQVGLKDRVNHLPTELSGGQQQRVAIARALVNQPTIILADEPTGNLDSKISTEIFEIFRQLNRVNRQTVILITHTEYALKFANKIIRIKDGKIA